MQLHQLSQQQRMRVVTSAVHLAKHMGEVPVMIIPCIHGRAENSGVLAQAGLYGSILPAAWSFMLALRAREACMTISPAVMREKHSRVRTSSWGFRALALAASLSRMTFSQCNPALMV